MPSHPDRVRQNYTKCMIGDEPHSLYYLADSDRAPYINSDGTRSTVMRCLECNYVHVRTRSQKQFEEELKKRNPLFPMILI